MSDKEPLFHFIHLTDEDIKTQNIERGKSVQEKDKTEFVLNGEDLYYEGGGHSFGFGFYDEYITKTGLVAIRYHAGWWSIGNDRYEYKDSEFILIPEPEKTNEPTDFSSVSFPTVKNINAKTISSEIISVIPKKI